MKEDTRIAYFGAGCFWNSELIYSKQDGVTGTEVGWANVNGEGRVEVVKVEYNPSVTEYDDLLNIFWTTHDATSARHEDKSFVERSVLFPIGEEQRSQAIQHLRAAENENPQIKTVVVPFIAYTRAPEKDQQYYIGN